MSRASTPVSSPALCSLLDIATHDVFCKFSNLRANHAEQTDNGHQDLQPLCVCEAVHEDARILMFRVDVRDANVSASMHDTVQPRQIDAMRS